jgi:hypothetical protein
MVGEGMSGVATSELFQFLGGESHLVLLCVSMKARESFPRRWRAFGLSEWRHIENVCIRYVRVAQRRLRFGEDERLSYDIFGFVCNR